MNTKTLRFGVARTAVLAAVIAATAFYAGSARAETFEPQLPAAAHATALQAEVQAELKTEFAAALGHKADQHTRDTLAALRTARVDLLSKVAASALAAPRGFVLALPAALVAPTL